MTSEQLKCSAIRNRTSVVIKTYEGIPELFILNIVIATVLIGIFILLRSPKKRSSVSFLYNQKKYNRSTAYESTSETDFTSLPRTPASPKGYFDWIRFVIKLTDEDFLKACGPDAVHYLSFQKHLMVVLIIVTAVCLVLILPINYCFGNNYGKMHLGRTTMANLSTDSHWLWVHVVVILFYVPLIAFTMQDASGNKAFETAAQVRTIFVKNIQPSERSESFIRSYFESLYPQLKIEKVQLTYKYSEYLKYYKEYMKVRSALDYLNVTEKQLTVSSIN